MSMVHKVTSHKVTSHKVTSHKVTSHLFVTSKAMVHDLHEPWHDPWCMTCGTKAYAHEPCAESYAFVPQGLSGPILALSESPIAVCLCAAWARQIRGRLVTRKDTRAIGDSESAQKGTTDSQERERERERKPKP